MGSISLCAVLGVCVCRPPSYTTMVDIMTAYQTGNQQPVQLSIGTVVANTSGFIGAPSSVGGLNTSGPYLLALQTMNEYLLNDKVRARLGDQS